MTRKILLNFFAILFGLSALLLFWLLIIIAIEHLDSHNWVRKLIPLLNKRMMERLGVLLVVLRTR